MKNISMPIVCKICTSYIYRSETFSLHNHAVKDIKVNLEYLPNFSHVDKVSQKNPEFTNQLLWFKFSTFLSKTKK